MGDEKRKKKKKPPRFYLIVIGMVLIISSGNLTGCTRFSSKDDKTALNDDYGFINKQHNETNDENGEDKNKNEDKANKKEDEVKNEEKKETVNKTQGTIAGTNCIESAKVNGVSKYDVESMLNGTYEGDLADEKMVFLTFDDGPSNNTIEVLNVLKKYDVHGTFFVLGNSVKNNPEYLKKVYEGGNAIGNHTYNHSYKKIYPNQEISVPSYMEEYYKTEDAIKSVLGQGFSSKLIRMPGGEMSRRYYKDAALPTFKDRLKTEKIASVDWNALNGDAEGKNYSVNELVEYAKKSSAGKNHVVLLMHDTEQKYLTVRALPQIIEYFKAEGYSFKIMI